MFPWHIVALAELLGRHLFHVELLSGCENSSTLTKTLDVCGEVCFGATEDIEMLGNKMEVAEIAFLLIQTEFCGENLALIFLKFKNYWRMTQIKQNYIFLKTT